MLIRLTTEQMCDLFSNILSLIIWIGFAVFRLKLSHATFLHIAWGHVKMVFLSAFLTEPCHSKNSFIHDHTCTKNNIIYYISVRVASHQRKTLKTLLRPGKLKDVVRTWSK